MHCTDYVTDLLPWLSELAANKCKGNGTAMLSSPAVHATVWLLVQLTNKHNRNHDLDRVFQAIYCWVYV